MRMINADALRHWIEGECKSPSIPRNEVSFGRRILMHMELMESEDVRPVVRCKDCVYWSGKKTRYCNMLKGTFQENDYCSYAERCTDE